MSAVGSLDPQPDSSVGPGAAASPESEPAGSPRLLSVYQLATVIPIVTWILLDLVLGNRAEIRDPVLLLWIVAIAVVDLIPVPTSSNLHFSMSFPLELAAALIYRPSVAAAIALLGTSDIREFHKDLSLLKALFIRSQIAVSVAVESFIFHSLASVPDPWYQLAGAVAVTTLVGYCTNVLLVAWHVRLEKGTPVGRLIRQMHSGIFGEFVLSYTGLALFGVIVATFFIRDGVWSIVVFVAPMAFARQMFVRTHSLKVATDELELRQREKEHQALHDHLTGLPNRVLFMERLQEAISTAQEQGLGVAVVILDLDDFKDINDTLGHHFGDLLLQEIRPRLEGVLRHVDTVARLGGDEFGIVIPDVPNREVAQQVAERMLERLAQPIMLEGFMLVASASIGIALYPEHSEDIDTLLRRADVAMYAAKDARTGYQFYDPRQDRYSPERLTLLGQLRPALDAGEFETYYQPKADLSDGRIRGAEALVRWHHPQRGILAPDEFIPLAEQTALLRPLTLTVFEQAIQQCRTWRALGLDLEVSVNLSVRSLLDLELPGQVQGMLEHFDVPPSCLVVEITESTLMADSGRSVDVLTRLSAVGVGLSIDDFGTGYSSLSYLKRLSLNEIKIDRSFVMNMAEDANDATIVRATVELGHHLGLRVVAEGVERLEHWQELKVMGCDVAQGYFLSRPIPSEAFFAWLSRYDTGLHPPTVTGLDTARPTLRAVPLSGGVS